MNPLKSCLINKIICGDCRQILPQILSKNKIDLVLTDPPYNIKFDKYNTYNDRLPDEEYIKMLNIFKNLPTAIISYPESYKYIQPAMGVPNKVLAWCYNANIPRRFRLITIFNTFPDLSKIKQSYKNPNDKRIKKLIKNGHKGTSLYEWFNDIQLVKNISKEKTNHPCPVPIKLMERLILLLTKKGDMVLDPFMGSGTTAIACKNTNRYYIGIELSQEYCDLSAIRLQKINVK